MIFQFVELCTKRRWELGLLEEHAVKTRRECVHRDHRLDDVRLLLVSAVALCIAGPALQQAGVLDPLATLDGSIANILGIVLACLGIAMTVLAQFAMGDAWRVGVDPSERTKLVTNGLTIAGAILLTVALELHVRLIEEPHLQRIHGQQYTTYAARVGRFLPRIGRLRPDGNGAR